MKRSVCTALSVLLLLAMLCASLAGCKKETPKNPAPGTAATETDTGDGGLDAVDYGGAKLKFLTYKEGDSIATANELDGDFNGGPVEKGVYTRNSVLEEKYNVTFTHTDMRANDSRIVERVGMLFNAGSEDIDYVLAGTMNTNSCGIRGYTLAAQDVPFLRTEGDWWYSDFLEATEIKGKNFFLMGDFAYTSWTMTTCIMFNETMAEKWGIDPEEIFTLIRDGRWTLDRMIAYSDEYRSFLGTLEAKYPSAAFLKLHPGMTFSMGGLTVDVLYTHEEAVNAGTGKTKISDFNDSSTVLRVTFGGKRVLFLGDANKVIEESLIELYAPETLQADIVQIAHHGINPLNYIYRLTKGTYALVSNSEVNAHLNGGSCERAYAIYSRYFQTILYEMDATYRFRIADGELVQDSVK